MGIYSAGINSKEYEELNYERIMFVCAARDVHTGEDDEATLL
jgi:hypothetical protein